MISLTPPQNSCLRWEGMIDNYEIASARLDIVSFVVEEAVTDVLRNVVRDKLVRTNDQVRNCTKLRIDVLVLSRDQYRQAIDAAYLEGMKSASYRVRQ